MHYDHALAGREYGTTGLTSKRETVRGGGAGQRRSKSAGDGCEGEVRGLDSKRR